MLVPLKPQATAPLPAAGRFILALSAACLLAHCTSAPKSEVVVSVKDQKMGLYAEGKLVKKYVISTSKFGLGDAPGSCCTPLGKHEVVAKIGHGLPPGAVLKSRSWNGEVLKPNAAGRDPIVSRILWLKGLEGSNKNAYKRYIYIHGTPEEKNLGQPASYGCIRMGMKDVVSVFDDLSIGAKVVITKGPLPNNNKLPSSEESAEDATVAGADKPADGAKADPAPNAAAGKNEAAEQSGDATAKEGAKKLAWLFKGRKEPAKPDEIPSPSEESPLVDKKMTAKPSADANAAEGAAKLVKGRKPSAKSHKVSAISGKRRSKEHG